MMWIEKLSNENPCPQAWQDKGENGYPRSELGYFRCVINDRQGGAILFFLFRFFLKSCSKLLCFPYGKVFAQNFFCRLKLLIFIGERKQCSCMSGGKLIFLNHFQNRSRQG